MNLLSTLTGLAKYAASISVGTVVGNLVAVTTPANAKPITKMSIGLGTFILTGVISDMAMTYVEKQIFDIATMIVTAKANVEVLQAPETKELDIQSAETTE